VPFKCLRRSSRSIAEIPTVASGGSRVVGVVDVVKVVWVVKVVRVGSERQWVDRCNRKSQLNPVQT
jgi:phosphoribulokinase